MEEKIIEFVKRNEFIYNKNHKDHKNFHLRNQKFNELSKQLVLDTSVKRVKERWRCLKDKFYSEVKRLKRSSASGNTSPKKVWKWMELMMFLKDSYTPPECTSRNFNNHSDSDIATEVKFEEHFLVDCNTRDWSSEDDIICTTPELSENKVLESLLEVQNNMSELVKTDKTELGNKLIDPSVKNTAKTPAQLFFESLASQVANANISPQKFGHLQVEILRKINEILYS